MTRCSHQGKEGLSVDNKYFMSDISTGSRLAAGETKRLIEAYLPLDPVSAEYQRQFLGLIERAPDHFANRHNYELGLPGHFTAQAVVYNAELGSVALMHHAKLGIWVGPGGHIDAGDANAEMGARREAEEEMGLTDLVLMQAAPFDLDVHGFPAKGSQPDHLHYDIRFLFSTTQVELRANYESRAVEWTPLETYPDRVGRWLSNSRLIRGLQSLAG